MFPKTISGQYQLMSILVVAAIIFATAASVLLFLLFKQIRKNKNLILKLKKRKNQAEELKQQLEERGVKVD